MNLKLDENNKAIFIFDGKEYVIVNAVIIGNYIDVESEDGKLFVIPNSEENIRILGKTHPETLI